MSKKIIYWVQGYRPENEAVSKEIRALSIFFAKQAKVTIHDLSIEPFKFSFNKNYISYYNKYIPLGLMIIPNLKCDISHIYTSLGDLPYLTLLKKRPIILTAALSAPIKKIKKQLKYYYKLDKIVVESEKDREILLSLGIINNRIKTIVPGIDLSRFNFKKSNSKRFTILFASSPPRKDMFDSTGTNLLLEAAKVLEKEVDFIFLWRKTGYNKLMSKIDKNKITNVRVINKTIKNMNEIYRVVDATIASPLVYYEFKPMPNSIIESLASGKPVLVSNISGIKDVVSKERCGLVFAPKNIVESIRRLKKDYEKYQKNCRKTAEKYFSLDKFLDNYKKLYNSLCKN